MTRAQAGFTLIELLLVVAIVGMLAVFAVPGFGEFYARRAVVAAASTLAGDYRFARAEAIKRSGFVTLCRSTNGTSCASTKDSWHTGWLVFADYNGNGDLDSSTDEILRVQQTVSGVSSIANATASNTVLKATFRPNGMGLSVAETLILQASNSTAQGTTRLLCISALGRTALRDSGASTC